MLLSIGEISAMVNVSKDTLRYYDEVGILKPHMIDQDNGYRYYDDHQIKTILQILDYKYYGFALEDIKWLLVCEDSELLKLTLAKQYERILTQINELSEKANRLKMKAFKNGGNDMDKKKILIVDDVAFMREILEEILEKNGYSTIAAQDGIEAYQRYQDESPDLVLMDIEMPVMNGIECTKKIIEFDSNAKIIMLSALFNQENLEASIGAGARYFQPKPFHSDVLLYSISREFNGKLGEAL